MFKKNNIRNNRSGQIFVISVVIAITVALISSYIILNAVFKEKSAGEFLGSYQSGIVDALSDGSKVQLYIDEAAKIAVSKGIDEYIYGTPPILEGEDTAEYPISSCGNYVYELWNNETKDCYPNYLDSEHFKLNYLISKNLNKLTQSKESNVDINLDRILTKSINYEYRYNVDSATKKTTIYGQGNDNYDITIFRDLETRNNEDVQKYLQDKNTYSGELIWPLESNYHVISCFGYRGPAAAGEPVQSPNHAALDIPAPINTPVLAAADGTIEEISRVILGTVLINHGGGIKTLYMHMNTIKEDIKKGDIVKQGEIIGYVGGRGEDGNPTHYGSHLHFEVISLTIDTNTNYEGISAVIPQIKSAENRVNPLCFIGQTKQDITFNMNSKACNSICNADKCASPDPKELNGAPYKFCNIYNGVVVKEVACIKQLKTDWKITNVKFSSTKLTSDQTLTINFTIENNAETCVNIRPEIIVTNSNNNEQRATDESFFGNSINVYPTKADKKTASVAITCTFNDDKTVIQRETAAGKCVILLPLMEQETIYKINTNVKDYNSDIKNSAKEYEEITVTKTVKKEVINSNEEITKTYNEIKSKITSNLRPIIPGEEVIIVAGNNNKETQKLYLVKEQNGKIIIDKEYKVSLAKAGFGFVSGSDKTPTGLHIIKDKLADGVAKGTILTGAGTKVGAVTTIYTDKTNAKEDYVTTRVLRLDGVESSNQNSYSRLIYIHGTPEEGLIGIPESHGCVRMTNDDVIDLFNLVHSGASTGTYVYISENLETTNIPIVTSKNNVNNQNTLNLPKVELTPSEQKKIDTTLKNLESLGIVNYINEIAIKETIPKEILLGLITQESAGNLNALSPTGATGLFQVIQSYHIDRVKKECGSWETFKTDAQCQVRVGAGILKAYYTQYNTKGLYIQCSCTGNKGTTNCKNIDVKYTGWDAALRAYNNAGCNIWADYNFVDTVMKYAAGWGYQDITKEVTHEEIQQGIFGKYSIKPTFNVNLDFDITLFDKLKDFANKTVMTCGKEGENKLQCIDNNIKTFNNNLDSKYTGVELSTNCDESSDNVNTQNNVNTFIEQINDCIISNDNNCNCKFNPTENSEYTTFSSVNSVSKGTQFTYYNDKIELQAYLDNSITNSDNFWQQKNVKLTSIQIYKDKNNQLQLGQNSEVKSCEPIKNRFRFCLKTNYEYSIYDSDKDKIEYKKIKIPFAITIRDDIPPKPITGIIAYNLAHDTNSIILLWDKNSEVDITKYNIYLSDVKSDFEMTTVDFKNIAKVKTISILPQYEEYTNIDLEIKQNYPNCEIQSKDETDYCEFKYTATTDIEIPITLEKNKLYYINSTKKFMYIIDGSDTNNQLTKDTEKTIAITAIDMDGNEIDNKKEDRKLTENDNLISITPYDNLEKGLVKITSATVDENKKAFITWNKLAYNIDGTSVSSITNVKYNLRILFQETCPTEMQYIKEVESLELTCDNRDWSGCNDIDLSDKSPGKYCVALSAGTIELNNPGLINGNLEYENAFLKEITIPDKANP